MECGTAFFPPHSGLLEPGVQPDRTIAMPVNSLLCLLKAGFNSAQPNAEPDG
jgi:hypothetical protein